MPEAKKKFVPSKNQKDFFDFVETGAGSAIVEAVAGSGKTTSVVQALPLIPETATVRLLAFNAIIAKEMGERLDALREETGRSFANFVPSTFHSLGYSALRYHLKGVALKVDGKKLRTLFQRLCAERDRPDEFEDYGDFVVSLASLAKGEGIGALRPDVPEAWWELARHHDLETPTTDADPERGIELARDLMVASEAQARKGWIDFDDQLYLVVKWKLRLRWNDWVFVDEAQDTNPIRRAIAKLALRPGGRLVAVGDPRQAIYGFTGASHDALELIGREFGAVTLPLSVCYRCAGAVVEKAREVVSHIEPSPSAVRGAVLEGVSLEDALARLEPTDAILCRQTAPLVSTAYALIAKGIGATVLGKDIGVGLANLVRKMRAKGVDQLIEKLTVYRDREVAQHMAKGEEGKADAVTDRVECVLTIVDALDERSRTLPKLVERIEAMFADRIGTITLSTVHKAKGREWKRVAILRPDLMPSKWARQDWQKTQEENLRYVAYTRAMEELIILDPRDGASKRDRKEAARTAT